MKNVDRLQEMNQVNGSMVEAKREILERGFYHRPVYSEGGLDERKEKKRTIKMLVFNNVLFLSRSPFLS